MVRPGVDNLSGFVLIPYTLPRESEGKVSPGSVRGNHKYGDGTNAMRCLEIRTAQNESTGTFGKGKAKAVV